MAWTWANEFFWWEPQLPATALVPAYLDEADRPPEDRAPADDLPLSLRLFRTRDDGRLLIAIAAKERHDPDPEFVAASGRQAREFAGGMVRAVRWLHHNGVLLNWYPQVAANPGYLTTLVSGSNQQPVLFGGFVHHTTNGPAGPSPSPRRVLSRWWAWPRRAGSWQVAFLKAVNAAYHEQLADWHAVLRLIYFHRTAMRVPTRLRTDGWQGGHAQRTERQLERGFKAWARTAFLTRDSDQLHWGLGLRHGFRGWLRRLEAVQRRPA
jgi:hypothetical protein